jgi:hypothetical protein
MQLEQALAYNIAPFCDRKPVPVASMVGYERVKSEFVSLRRETLCSYQLSNLCTLIPPSGNVNKRVFQNYN